MDDRRITLPASLKAEIRRFNESSLELPLPEDRDADVVDPQFQTEVEQNQNRLADQDENRRWRFLQGAVIGITNMLRDADRFQKPLLTIDDAAAMLSLSPKRLENIICLERKRLGRSPDFLCDGGGRIQRRVLRDELLSWARRRGKNDRRRRMASEL